MRQRGKKSSAYLSVIHAEPQSQRLQPPAHLTPRQREIFDHLLANSPRDQFRVTDGLLLARLCEAHDLAEQAAAELAKNGPVVEGRASAWLVAQEKAVRAITALSTKLRLSPQARTDPRTLTRNAVGPRSFYDEMREAGDV
jgi:phage terminase small subunit